MALVVTEGDERLPRASTCFNTLFLPAYSAAPVLRSRLAQAISGEQAFDEGAWVLHVQCCAGWAAHHLRTLCCDGRLGLLCAGV